MQLINTDVKMHMACPGFVNTTMIRRAQKEAVGLAQTPAQSCMCTMPPALRIIIATFGSTSFLSAYACTKVGRPQGPHCMNPFGKKSWGGHSQRRAYVYAACPRLSMPLWQHLSFELERP